MNNAPGKTDKIGKMGFWMCLALVVGNIIGSGVFLLPASLAPYGLNSVFGWLMTAAGALLLAYVFSRLARAFPQAGGPYVYPRVAFGELTGFLMAWGYWISCWVGNAAIAIGAVASLAELIPALKTTVGAPALTACALIWLLTLLNWRGVRYAGAFQIVTTVLKLLPLTAVIILGCTLFIAQDTSVIRVEPQPFAFPAVAAAAALTLWALLGLESATVPSDDVIDPQRTIPRATLIGTLIAAVIYVLASTTVILLIPGSELAESNAPFADVVRIFWGDRAASTLALFAFISGIGALNGWILVQGEMPRVLAREGIFPEVFARDSKHGTPGHALFITSALITPVVLMNYSNSMVRIFTFIILIATAAFLVVYLLCSLAALKLAWRGEMGVKGGKLVTLLIVSSLAAIYSLWTLYGAGAEAFWWCMALLAAGLPVYGWMKRGKQLIVERVDS
ncbi:amino acid permease [Povalibacter sp.]|uniref:amino acid permease n=1 Tax=Povalibacter sp. TaxID=1962978 RepID=UPI002F3F2481